MTQARAEAVAYRPWQKVCPCCGTSYSFSGWLALADRGRQEPDLELRDCPCGSTLAVAIEPDGRRIP